MAGSRPLPYFNTIYYILIITSFLNKSSCIANSKLDFIYTAVAPRSIQVSSNYSIWLSVEQSIHSVKFDIILSSGDITLSQTETQLSPNSSKEVKLMISKPPYINDNGNSCSLMIKATKVDTEEFDYRLVNYYTKQYINQNQNQDTKELYLEDSIPNHLSLIIQTDKPIYKPGEVVQIRLILVNKLMKPGKTDELLQIQVIDSEKNIIKSWKDIEPDKEFGFVKNSFHLSKEPNLGKWTIEATIGNNEEQTQTHSFSVDQYIPPKFMVELKLTPTFVTYKNSKFALEISLKYTHGQPAKGLCTLLLRRNINTFTTFNFGLSPGSESDESTESAETNQISRTIQVEGKTTLDFDLESDFNLKIEDGTEQEEFQIDISCADQVSGGVQNASETIKVYKYPYKITVAEQSPSYKPGFPFHITFKIERPDNTPVSDERPNALRIEHGFACRKEDGILTKSIPPSGLVPITFQTPSNYLITVDEIRVTYEDRTTTFYLPRREHSDKSDSEDNLQLIKLNETKSVHEGDAISISVIVKKPFNTLNYILIAESVILKSEQVILLKETSEYNLTIQVPSTPTPKLSLIVYTILPPLQNVIGDVLKFKVSLRTGPPLEISLLATVAEPGSNISIKLQGVPNSLIALRAIDQSVLILKGEGDLIDPDLENGKVSFQKRRRKKYFKYRGRDNIFNENGIHIFTNAILPQPYGYGWGSYSLLGGKKHKHTNNAVPSYSVSLPDQEVRIRKHFPEMWIFSEYHNTNGTVTIDSVVPDTITSWIIDGFQLSPEYGLSIGTPTKLVTFRPFFITLNLPYSVVQGEVFALKVNVHNYLGHPIDAKVTLDNSECAFAFVGDEGNNTNLALAKDISVESGSVEFVEFLITPLKIGTISLNLKAISPFSGDGVSQLLRVKSPGISHHRNSAFFINISSPQSKALNISAAFPTKIVPGSETLKLSVTGDILGGSIKNLDQLIQLPSGCGEQNMVNFVPDIVILDYLNVTNALTKGIEDKLLHYLETGYQQQLTYKREDGSFSAFGKSDKFGSTWLTAFVIRSFTSSKKYIHIDDNVLKTGLEFIAEQQTKTGSFLENGYVHNRDLQGGAGKGYALSAFCLLAFVDSISVQNGIKSDRYNYTKIVETGISWLISEKNHIHDVYSINLITYLLHVTNHPKKNEFFDKMETNSVVNLKSNHKYWKSTPKTQAQPRKSMNVNPAAVEMTSYALLTHLIRERSGNRENNNNLNNSIPIARWLMRQRNSDGGFLSTQDTVVGITALAKFGEATRVQKGDYGMKISIEGKQPNSRHSFYIGKHNRTDLQEYFLPVEPNERKVDVSVVAEGNGGALVQLSWTYNTLKSPSSSGFLLDVTVKSKNENRVLGMSICTEYTLDDRSNMAILEVNTPTGYSFDLEELTELKRKNDRVKRFETENQDTKLNLYFQYLNSDQLCIKINAYRIHVVAKYSKSSVVIYDYYDTTRRTQKFYNGPEVDISHICSFNDVCHVTNLTK